MGFDRATQTHVMRMVMNQNLVENSSGVGIVPRTGNSNLQVIIVAQLVFRVDYEGVACSALRGTYMFRDEAWGSLSRWLMSDWPTSQYPMVKEARNIILLGTISTSEM